MGIWNFPFGGAGGGAGGLWEKLDVIEQSAQTGTINLGTSSLAEYDIYQFQGYAINANGLTEPTMRIQLNGAGSPGEDGYNYRRWTVGTTGSVTETDEPSWQIFRLGTGNVGDRYLIEFTIIPKRGALKAPALFARFNRFNTGPQYQDTVGGLESYNTEVITPIKLIPTTGHEIAMSGILTGLKFE